MPKISLYSPEKNNNYYFIDKQISRQFQFGGTDIFVHKYIGPADPSNTNQSLSVTSIQDVLFLENRDRKYDLDIYTLRCHFQIQDLDFNLSQFGLFLQNDTIYMTVHINDSVGLIGRKLLAGDVIEIPILKDENALNDFTTALKRFYVVDSITRASEGYSPTWYPHLYKLKLIPVSDSQEFSDILNVPTEDMDHFAGDYVTGTKYYAGQIVRYNGTLYTVNSNITDGTQLTPPDPTAWSIYSGDSLQDLMSTYNKEMEINNAVVAEAESYVRQSGYQTQQFYTLAVDPITKRPILSTTNGITSYAAPVRSGYTGYLLGDGIPPNGEQFGYGIQFPLTPISGDFYLRTDYLPNRLFRFNGTKWTKFEDAVRMTTTNTDLDSVADQGTWSPYLSYNKNDMVIYGPKIYIANSNNMNQVPNQNNGYWTEYRQTLKTSFINNKTKTLLDPIYSDSFYLSNSYVQNLSDPTNYTASVIISTGLLTITTSITYNALYGAKALANGHQTMISPLRNNAGYIEFDILNALNIGDFITWTIYATVIDEQQGLSKAMSPKTNFGLISDN